jgi:hypothetical protein
VKVPVAEPPPPAEKRGVRGKVIANKKEEMTTYTAAITLEAPAKKIQVTVGNSNYQKKE